MEISENAKAFEKEMVDIMSKYADKLDANEAYQCLSLLLSRALGANITYLMKNGKSEDEVRSLFVKVIEQLIADNSSKH